jgi:hypothetical protein
MPKKQFIYLMQGQASLVESYFDLDERDNADAIFITYDKALDGAIFYPDSTWAEGRNRLLETALKREPYQYYIFCDDDILFERGSWEEFEQSLLEYKPGVAVPIFPKTRNSALKFPKLKSQSFFNNDEQLMAFHRDVVLDDLVLPYQTRFDKENWWASCEIQQILLQNFYPYDILQFNSIVVENMCEKRYKCLQENKVSFRDLVNDWLCDQFQGKYRLTSFYIPLRLHHLLLRTLGYKIKRVFLKNNAVSANLPERLLCHQSDLLFNYKQIQK